MKPARFCPIVLRLVDSLADVQLVHIFGKTSFGEVLAMIILIKSLRAVEFKSQMILPFGAQDGLYVTKYKL